MFSQTVEYALRAVMHLAQFPDEPQRTAHIAERTKVPVAYLTKVLQGLQRAGIVKLQRGIGGGVTIAIDPEELTILRVVSAVDPIQRIQVCPLQLKAHGSRLCSLHSKMDEALRRTEEAFAAVTLADLLRDPNPSKALCE